MKNKIALFYAILLTCTCLVVAALALSGRDSDREDWISVRCPVKMKYACAVPFEFVMAHPEQLAGRAIAIQGFLFADGNKYLLFSDDSSAEWNLRERTVVLDVPDVSDAADELVMDKYLKKFDRSYVQLIGIINLDRSKVFKSWVAFKPTQIGMGGHCIDCGRRQPGDSPADNPGNNPGNNNPGHPEIAESSPMTGSGR